MQNEHENMPLRFGSPDDYARVAGSLKKADFTEATICRTLALGNMSDLNSGHAKNCDLNDAPPCLALFIRLFLFFETVARLEIEMLIDRETIDAFLQLDILRLVAENDCEYYTSVFLYPVAGFYIASDRPVDPDGIVRERKDWVLPAIYEGTLNFLSKLITSPAGEALDLCSGAGIGAMALSRNARKAVAVDIAPRAVRYARFNKELNNLSHVEILESNLYDAVSGRTFDRIIAHPPYVPTIRNQSVFKDGGETGEYFVRSIIEGLPEYLRPDGTYYSLSFNLDTQSAPFEERARLWLGDSRQDFDIVFAVSEVRPVEKVIENILERENITSPDDMSRFRQAFEKIEAAQFVYGMLVIRRRKPEEQGTPCTLRIEMTAGATGNDLVKMLKNRSAPIIQ